MKSKVKKIVLSLETFGMFIYLLALCKYVEQQNEKRLIVSMSIFQNCFSGKSFT